MNALRATARTIYDLVVGDDWRIAAAVLAAIGLAGILVASGASDWVVAVVTTATVMMLFAAAVLLDVRRQRRVR